MCALIGSYDPDKFYELYQLNSYRGALTSSLATINREGVLSLIGRWSGESIERHHLDDIPPGDYIIGHSQAPTTLMSGIHPAESGEYKLWHNGILKTHAVRDLALVYDPLRVYNNLWDTELLARAIEMEGHECLSRIDGTFACFMHNPDGLFLFRNALSPIFKDEYQNVSSTKFAGSSALKPGILFKFNPFDGVFEPTEYTFTTFNNPYFLKD